jgi:DNA polymerase I-like protein with 3'-5' exonuclease and polymerase domains
MNRENPIAWDTETALIAPGLQAPPLVCVSIADGLDAELVHHTEAREWIVGLLESDRVLVGHNVAFDFGVVAAVWPDLMPLIFDKYSRGEITDTMLRQKLIDIASSSRGFKRYTLEELARRWLRKPLDKDTWRTRYGELFDVPVAWWPQGARDYAIEDARTTLEIWRSQESQNRHLADEFRQARAAWWLHLMRCWGMRTDGAAVEALATRLQDRHDTLEAGLVSAGLMRADGTRNTKAAQARMRDVCKRKGLALVVTPKGAPKLSHEVCEAVGDELLEHYAEVSGLKTKLSNFVGLLRKGTSTPIQPYVNTLLETGRTSMSPNVQNLPRKGGVRECFVPRPGNVFAAADYSGFELRTVSQVMLTTGVCSRSKLADALNAGFDPHLEIARRIVGCSYDEAARRLADGDDEIDTARQVGKVANFGFPGGLGVRTFVLYAKKGYGVTITEDEAAALKRYWFEAWPEFVPYFAWISNQCESGPAKIEQVFVQRYRGGCSYCEAANSMFQGLASDAAKHAGFLVARACYVDTSSPLFGARIVNFVHDELIVEVRDDERASDAAEELARLMIEGASKFLPDVPPLAVPYLMRRWSKGAKPVRNDEGRLIPWAA